MKVRLRLRPRRRLWRLVWRRASVAPRVVAPNIQQPRPATQAKPDRAHAAPMSFPCRAHVAPMNATVNEDDLASAVTNAEKELAQRGDADMFLKSTVVRQLQERADDEKAVEESLRTICDEIVAMAESADENNIEQKTKNQKERNITVENMLCDAAVKEKAAAIIVLVDTEADRANVILAAGRAMIDPCKDVLPEGEYNKVQEEFDNFNKGIDNELKKIRGAAEESPS